MGERDEISIGIVPENYPARLPGFKARSVGFLARSGGLACKLSALISLS